MSNIVKIIISLFFTIINLEKLSPCSVCKKIAKNFRNGLIDTENNTFEGGTSYGQNKKLTNYKDSELRFITVMEKACNDFSEKHQCLGFIDKYEDDILDWFQNRRNLNIDIDDHICVDISKVCCQKNHYGSKCLPCSGFINGVICSEHGFCSGDGTKGGSGKCICDRGYSGEICDKCNIQSYLNSEGQCIPCHISCEGPCLNETIEGCVGNCSSGYKKNDKEICYDVDECIVNNTLCKVNEFCLNTLGSYECRKCPEPCFKCNGTEASDCQFCNPGFHKNDESLCVDDDECSKNTHDCKGRTYCKNTYSSFECLDCHKGCLSGCTGPLLSDCLDCAYGYTIDENTKGCKDIDECQNDFNLCKIDEYCRNLPGEYRCTKCDIACKLCHGPGPHNCEECSEGYKLHDNFCQDENKIKDQSYISDEL